MNRLQVQFWRQWEWGKLIEWGNHPKGQPIYKFFAFGPIEARWFTPADEPILSLDLDRSNGINKCLHCGVGITPENDSGWLGFTATGDQPICKDCQDSAGPCSKCRTKTTWGNCFFIRTRNHLTIFCPECWELVPKERKEAL